jgi:hypothetical protein
MVMDLAQPDEFQLNPNQNPRRQQAESGISHEERQPYHQNSNFRDYSRFPIHAWEKSMRARGHPPTVGWEWDRKRCLYDGALGSTLLAVGLPYSVRC